MRAPTLRPALVLPIVALVVPLPVTASDTAPRDPPPAPAGAVATTSPAPLDARRGAPVPARDTARSPTADDVAFVRGMIAHHAQALVLTGLASERTARRELLLLAERIAVSQRDEIAIMEAWLATYARDVPDTGAAHRAHAGHDAMPGMLSAAEIDAVRAERETAFDRAFLRAMIRHHEGALEMVSRLLQAPANARQTQLHQFVADVDADQRAEIARMRRLLATLPPG